MMERRRHVLTLGALAALAAALALVPVARALAPPGQYTVGADTVLDNETGLVWQRGVSASQISWSSGLQGCEGLTLAGKDDWRLPNHRELITIVDHSVSPAVDQEAFPNTPTQCFWTSNHTGPLTPVVIIFAGGDRYPGTGACWTRCVRGPD
jgi:hypothetical protein